MADGDILTDKSSGRLEKRLKQALTMQAPALPRDQVRNLADRLGVDVLDCAAALLLLCQPQDKLIKPAKKISAAPVRQSHRSVRYRLDVGSQHHVGQEQIKTLLVEESGVDKKRIGRIDIRPDHTLVELPDGMPADIFQLLSEATLANRRLAIKRVKPGRRNLSRGGDKS